jgi:hypothetical protein
MTKEDWPKYKDGASSKKKPDNAPQLPINHPAISLKANCKQHRVRRVVLLE